MILSSLTPDFTARPIAAIGLAFGGGVLASLSPCLYPMIPVTLSIVGGNGASSRRRVSLAFIYVTGLASAYSLLGLIAGLSGTMFGAISTSPWLSFTMANVMLLAAAM